MNIGFDIHFLSKISQGTGTYSFQLVNALKDILDKEQLILLNKRNIVGIFGNGYNLGWGRLLLNYTPFNVLYGYNKLVYEQNLDIIHTNYLCSILPSKAKKVVTVHDILFKTHSQYFPLSLRLGVDLFSKKCFAEADKIIAVSNYTKQQLIQYYPQTCNKIEVIYEAASKDFYLIEDKKFVRLKIEDKFNIKKPYILFVGRFAPIKNIEFLISYYRQTHNNEEYDLLLVGKFDKSFPNIGLEKYIQDNSNVKVLTEVSNTDLNLLYNGATLFYFVSRGEGFGLPILEAMSAGCPVLTSNITACNEIAGDAAVKVNPCSLDEVFNAMDFLLDNEEYRIKMACKGLEHSRCFSWEKCAQETLKLYRTLVMM